MPAKDTINDVVDFVSPDGVSYKIFKTTQTDAYDQPPARRKKGQQG